jgi:hypothetical protein
LGPSLSDPDDFGLAHLRQRRSQIPRLPGKAFLPARRRTQHHRGTRKVLARGMLDTLSDLDEDVHHPKPLRAGCYCIAQAFEWPKLLKQIRRIASDTQRMNDDVARASLATWDTGSRC